MDDCALYHVKGGHRGQIAGPSSLDVVARSLEQWQCWWVTVQYEEKLLDLPLKGRRRRRKRRSDVAAQRRCLEGLAKVLRALGPQGRILRCLENQRRDLLETANLYQQMGRLFRHS